MTHPFWPLLDLRLSVGDLVLSAMTEADLDEVAAALPDDLELDPGATRYDLPADVGRGVVAHQTYWKAMGTWSPQDWELLFCVRRGPDLLGVQGLEGRDFPALRTVDTSSWLVAPARGSGVGKRMRGAVLALAFGPLQARAAITSAWHDNAASLGVSRSIGYLPNGESFLARDGGADTLVHLRLTRERWLATAEADEVVIDGFGPTRPLFGLDPAVV